MAYDAFLKLDGITGESTSSSHKGWIELLSFSFGIAAGPSSSSGQAAGKRSHSSLSITKNLDSASPQLLTSVINDGTLKSAQIDLVKTDATGKESTFFSYNFTEVLISELEDAGTAAGQDLPVETLTLNFLKIEELLPAVQSPTTTTTTGAGT